MAKILFWASVALAVGVAVSLENKTVSVLDLEEWWGPNELKGRQDTRIRRCQVKFQPEMIEDLRNRLKRHRKWAPPLEDVGFEYGFNTNQLHRWLSYWSEKYSFSDRETFLNQFPQFKTNIQGLDIHFIRVKRQTTYFRVETVPLLLLHGWPGSVREFYEAIPLLTKQTPGYDIVFEVIVPSLPGYGLSDAAVRPGLGASRVAVIMRNLMKRLGFKQFYIHGEGWGAIISSAMATLYPEDILGHHSNMLTVRNPCFNPKMLASAYFPTLVVNESSTICANLLEDFGYFHQQSTKPDTTGLALSESPAGLLAYILEKFSTWTNPNFTLQKDGGLDQRFTKDQLIDNLMLYWSTNSITTSMRIYAETFSNRSREFNLESIRTRVPTWIIQAKHEPISQPPEIIKTKFPNLLHTTVLDDGGHFLALELPKVFAEDVFKAVNAFREWHEENYDYDETYNFSY